MLAEGVFSDLRPDAVFGLHARAQLAVGRAAYTPGGALAAVDHFRVTIRGRQSHGAAPHLGIDPGGDGGPRRSRRSKPSGHAPCRR